MLDKQHTGLLFLALYLVLIYWRHNKSKNQPTSCLKLPLRCQVHSVEKIYVNRLQQKACTVPPWRSRAAVKDGPVLQVINCF